MKISEFSQLTGLSAHTLRYYEKIGLLTVTRKLNGHREYHKQDLEWASFVNRLRDTGMPLKQIKQYAELRAKGSITMQARKDLLQQHADILQVKIEQEQQHLQTVIDKVRLYEEWLENA